VAASGGYPGPFKTGLPISGIEKADAMTDVKVFHAGTSIKDGKVVTSGGRVLGVTAIGKTLADAQRKAYQGMSQIHFEGIHFRKDIGMQAIKGITV
jgi:phosphoribosylamine--glycine ligase